MALRSPPTCPTAVPVLGKSSAEDVRKALLCGSVFLRKVGWSSELREFFDLWLDFWLLDIPPTQGPRRA